MHPGKPLVDRGVTAQQRGTQHAGQVRRGGRQPDTPFLPLVAGDVRVGGVHDFGGVGGDPVRRDEVCTLLGAGVVLAVGEGWFLRVTRVVRVDSVSGNDVLDEDIEMLDAIIRGGEILDQDVGLPEDEFFAGVSHGRIRLNIEVGGSLLAVVRSDDPPDGVRMGCVFIDQDEFACKVVRVELLADGEVRYVAKVDTF